MHPHHAAMEQMAIMRGAESQPSMNTMCRLVVVEESSAVDEHDVQVSSSRRESAVDEHDVQVQSINRLKYAINRTRCAGD
jgi:hypothetical protein